MTLLSSRRHLLTTQLVCALLFFGFPITALAYFVWDLPGLLFGGGIALLGLAALFLFQKEHEAKAHPKVASSLAKELVHMRHLLEEEARARFGLDELLRQREEESAELHAHYQEVESFAEQKTEEAVKLATMVGELKGEIRRLLNLEPAEETEDPIPEDNPSEDLWVDHLPHSSKKEVANQYDAHLLLNQCLERAHALTGVRQLAGTSKRFEELSMGDYAIDLRQLFEAFRQEAGAALAIYSPKEERLLFASNLIRGLLGWGPDRFVRDFNWLIRRGAPSWRETVSSLGLGDKAHLEMAFRSASDEEVVVGCAVARIPQGAYRGLVIAVLYRVG